MGLYSRGLIIGRIFVPEIWGLIFERAFFFCWGGGGGGYNRNFTVLVGLHFCHFKDRTTGVVHKLVKNNSINTDQKASSIKFLLLQVAKKILRVTPHFCNLQCNKMLCCWLQENWIELSLIFRNVARQDAACDMSIATWNAVLLK